MKGSLLRFAVLAIIIGGSGIALLWQANKHLTEANLTLRGRLTSLLAAEFETVVYADAGLLARDKTNRHKLPDDQSELVERPFATLIAGLDRLSPAALESILTRTQEVFAGAKDFRPPAGLGIVHSTNCFVFVLAPHNTFNIEEYFHQGPTRHTEALPVWSWEADIREFGDDDGRASVFYVTQIGHSFLLISNDLDELQKMAHGVSSSDTQRIALEDMPDWESLSKYQFWEYRKYRHFGVIDSVASDMRNVAPDARVIILVVDTRAKSGFLQVSGDSSNAAAKLSEEMKESLQPWPPLKQAGEHTWKTDLSFPGGTESFGRVYTLEGMFGFPTYG